MLLNYDFMDACYHLKDSCVLLDELVCGIHKEASSVQFMVEVP